MFKNMDFIRITCLSEFVVYVVGHKHFERHLHMQQFTLIR